MPTYNFHCKKCDSYFEDLCSFDEIESVKCVNCTSKRVEKLISLPAGVVFKNPSDTSKWDSFSYRAGYNAEKAKAERRAAEAQHKGKNPYKNIDDSAYMGKIV